VLPDTSAVGPEFTLASTRQCTGSSPPSLRIGRQDEIDERGVWVKGTRNARSHARIGALTAGRSGNS